MMIGLPWLRKGTKTQQLFVQEFEDEAEDWREGPYGVSWVQDKISKLPTPKKSFGRDGPTRKK